MIRFSCDYAEGAHPKVLERLTETNLCQSAGYGEDPWCDQARDTIRGLCRAPEAQVQFLVGGTQVNFTVIAAALRPYQGVIAAHTGHIAVHETGSVEATGHKVLTLPSEDGTITADQIEAYCAAHFADADHEHMVQPGMVYLSLPTENGTVYTLARLEAISAVCQRRGLGLYVDGARLGCALAVTDITLPDLARLTSAFTIGGTKLGALFGEALVISDPVLARDFRYSIKQRGGMLAKGRLLGIQFQALLEDGLYFDIASQEVRQAMELKAAFRAKGFDFLYDSPTNQQFPLLTPEAAAALSENYAFSHWADLPDGRIAARFCTSWATTDQAVSQLIRDIEAL